MPDSRLFLAIPIPAGIRNEIAEVMNALRQIDGIRLVPPENYHVTVHFFGNVADDKIQKLVADIENQTKSGTAFTLQADKLSFLKQRHAGMIWIKFFPCHEFSLLARNIQQMAVERWQSKQEKEQTPHITCARIKDKQIQSLPLPSIKQYEIAVDHFELWKSINGKDGVKYIPLHSFQLQEQSYLEK